MKRFGFSLLIALFAMLMSVEAMAQGADPSMQFRNGFKNQRIEIWVYCWDHGMWTNNQRPLKLRPGETASLSLHTGNFQVVARNQSGQEDRNNRVLAVGEVDRMVVAALYSGPGRKRWGIIDDGAPDDE
jgi:hypothetical protein